MYFSCVLSCTGLSKLVEFLRDDVQITSVILKVHTDEGVGRPVKGPKGGWSRKVES